MERIPYLGSLLVHKVEDIQQIATFVKSRLKQSLKTPQSIPYKKTLKYSKDILSIPLDRVPTIPLPTEAIDGLVTNTNEELSNLFKMITDIQDRKKAELNGNKNTTFYPTDREAIIKKLYDAGFQLISGQHGFNTDGSTDLKALEDYYKTNHERMFLWFKKDDISILIVDERSGKRSFEIKASFLREQNFYDKVVLPIQWRTMQAHSHRPHNKDNIIKDVEQVTTLINDLNKSIEEFTKDIGYVGTLGDDFISSLTYKLIGDRIPDTAVLENLNDKLYFYSGAKMYSGKEGLINLCKAIWQYGSGSIAYAESRESTKTPMMARDNMIPYTEKFIQKLNTISLQYNNKKLSLS